MTQNQGTPGSGAGAGDPNDPGTNAAVQRASGYSPHGTVSSHEESDAFEQLPTRFADPGLPAHVHRLSDVDVKAARRAEWQVTRLFLLSFAGTVLFVFAFFAFPLTSATNIARSRLYMGLGLGIALFCIGAGAVHWAKKLMPDDEVVEERHITASSQEDREAAQGILRQGAEATGFPRRRLIWGSMTAAMGALALPAIIPLRDLWIRGEDQPSPVEELSTTLWKKGTRLMTDPGGSAIRAQDLQVGTVVHCLPEGIDDAESPEDEKAKAALLLMRLRPDELNKGAELGYQGIVAYSEICTHMGCPVALYEQQTHHLLCPCHQSTFDVPNGCKVIFGPANRPLPQLAITVDAEGYLVARRGFDEPVGPSFWERG